MSILLLGWFILILTPCFFSVSQLWFLHTLFLWQSVLILFPFYSKSMCNHPFFTSYVTEWMITDDLCLKPSLPYWSPLIFSLGKCHYICDSNQIIHHRVLKCPFQGYDRSTVPSTASISFAPIFGRFLE